MLCSDTASGGSWGRRWASLRRLGRFPGACSPPARLKSFHRELYATYIATQLNLNWTPVFAVDRTKVRRPPSLQRPGFKPQQRASKNSHALMTAIDDFCTGEIAAYDLSGSFDERGARRVGVQHPTQPVADLGLRALTLAPLSLAVAQTSLSHHCSSRFVCRDAGRGDQPPRRPLRSTSLKTAGWHARGET